MSLLVAFGAGEIGDRQFNEYRWPSCTPFVWAWPEDERGGGSPTGGSDFFVGRFRNTQSSPIGASPASGRTAQSSRKQGATPLSLEGALAFPVNDRFGSNSALGPQQRKVRSPPPHSELAATAPA